LAIPDGELLARASTYESQALAEVYDRYAQAIYRYLYRYLGDATQAEDLTGDVFVRLLEVLNTRRAPRDHLQGWLYRVAHNMAMDCFRTGSKMQTAPLEDSLMAEGDPLLVTVEKKQAGQALREAISHLTSDQQQVLLLRFGEELKLAEVAQLMDRGEGAIKTLQHRAIKRLRTLLNERQGR
jgi:RNA polymerase sigma-70 factor (ECF subfamily)